MKTEKVFAILIVLGLLFKFVLGWPGGGTILVSALSVLNILYVFGAFYFFSVNGIKNQNLILSILAGMCLGCTIVGIMFKIMYWPGANEMFMIGTIPCIIILIVSIINSKKDNRSSNDFASTVEPSEERGINMKIYYKNLQLRAGIITGFAIILYFTPITSLIKFQYRNNPELARLKVKSYTNPQNEEYKRELKEYEAGMREE